MICPKYTAFSALAYLLVREVRSSEKMRLFCFPRYSFLFCFLGFAGSCLIDSRMRLRWIIKTKIFSLFLCSKYSICFFHESPGWRAGWSVEPKLRETPTNQVTLACSWEGMLSGDEAIFLTCGVRRWTKEVGQTRILILNSVGGVQCWIGSQRRQDYHLRYQQRLWRRLYL